MKKRVLITGGAGFIGSHLTDALLAQGHDVRILDHLCEQVHGNTSKAPAYLNLEAEFLEGDVRDASLLGKALEKIDVVFHLAAAVGVGQSMYEIQKYTAINNLGTAALLEALIEKPVERLVVASSMSLYGEGLYSAADGTQIAVAERDLQKLKSRDWELRDGSGAELNPIATPETKPPSLNSIYALSKYDQERMCLMIGRAYGFSTTALRFFNVYGTRQSLSNPYTGVMAIFASRLLNQNRPLIFEDGKQQRDFVSVHDIVQACRLAMEVPKADGQVFNIGSGNHYSIKELALELMKVRGIEDIEPEITENYRAGDIRHCFADISQARRILGYQPKISLSQGLEELVNWLEGQVAVDNVSKAREELILRGLTA